LDLRNAIKAIFGNPKKYGSLSAWREIGNYSARFTGFNGDIYANDIVRACIRALAEHSSKADVKVVRRTNGGRIEGDQRLQRILQYRPNLYANGKDFLYKVRTLLEINNIAFIYIQRDDFGRCIGLYPMPRANYEAVEANGELYITFRFANGLVMTHPWADLAVLRKDYNSSDIFGDNNNAILTSLDLLTVTNEGMANAIKSTANLRGILKSTKAMLSPEDAKRQKDRFVEDYMTMANGSGIASLDATQDFIPISLQPQIADYKNVEELRNNIYRYFGVNEDIIMSRASGDSWEAFYESRLEPFLLALGLELTNKIFTEREKGFGNEIVFEANRLAYASTAAKLNMVQLIDRGVLTINEYREILNLAPVDGGDVRVIRKEYAEAAKLNEIQGVDDDADKTGQGIQGADAAPADEN
jgi:HK97 family phage portal protein